MGLGGRVSIYPEKKLLTSPFGNPEASDTDKQQIVVPIDELGDASEEKVVPISIDVNDEGGESGDGVDEEVVVKKECRVCQDEDLVCKLEIPCACIGSLMYAHRSCIQRWCDTRGSIRCEICKQCYSPDYTAKDPFEEETVEISEPGYLIPGTNVRIYTPLELFGMAIDRISRSMNQDFDLRHPTPGALFGLALLIFMAVMVISDAYNYAPPREDKLNHTLYCIITIIAVPVYILQWIFLCMAHRDRERAERERESVRAREREMKRENDHSA